MKKVILCSTLSLLLLNPLGALAASEAGKTKVSASDVSSDTRILSAVKIMKDTPANASYKRILGNNPTKRPIRIDFKNLAQLINHMENMMV